MKGISHRKFTLRLAPTHTHTRTDVVADILFAYFYPYPLTDRLLERGEKIKNHVQQAFHFLRAAFV